MFTARPMTPADVPACTAIINDIIARGGTTAHEDPFDEAGFKAHYLDAPPVATVVEHNGRPIGFQSAFDVGGGLYSIGSFTDRRTPVKGAGRAMFAATLAACRAHGGTAILARITSDNASGLAYYSAMGFVDDHIVPADVTRKDGTVVDRVVKRFPL